MSSERRQRPSPQKPGGRQQRSQGRPGGGARKPAAGSGSRRRDGRPIPPPPKRQGKDPNHVPVPPREADVWIDEGPSTPARAKQRRSRPRAPSVAVRAPMLVELVGSKRAVRLEGRLSDAATAYSAERFPEVRSILAPLVGEVPDLPEARELYGLSLYRLGRWREAARELDAFVDLTGGSTEQHPVLMDCRRALGQYAKVEALWDDLRSTSPSGSLVVEGRIVAAGALADRGELAGAIALLGKGFKFPKRPLEHHLRRAYALADLYERSGDLPQARTLFSQVARAEPGFLDAAERAVGG